MLVYSIQLSKILKVNGHTVHSFISEHEDNIDWQTVNSFGSEWQKFNAFSEAEIQQIGSEYFDLVDETVINQKTIALDVGCGSGRWARYLASRVHFIEAIDPSQAVLSASAYLQDKKNVRISQASVNNIPFANESFDFVYSLGVLHHLPNTLLAIEKCHEKLKPGGWFLLYLYYAMDNRGFLYRLLFKVSTFFRLIISSLPQKAKQMVCDCIALIIYLPAARLSGLLASIPSLRKFAETLPLSYYRKTSFRVMQNDALDRFGTPLEKRFKRSEIEDMLKQAGFINIRFSTHQPFWHVIAQRPS